MLVAPSVTNTRQRIIDYGEVFTPPGLVNDMLDLVAHECEHIDSRFLEFPPCHYLKVADAEAPTQ